MKRRLLSVMAVASLEACTMSGSPMDSHRYEIALDEARDDASIDCVGQAACDAMWQRTLEFVKQHSVTNITRENKTVIETAEPHESGVLYLWASRSPIGDGIGSSTIRVKGLCRGMYTTDGDPAWMYVPCAALIMSAEREFRQFAAGAAPGKGTAPE
jgi:hypothetical protein